MFRRRVAVLPVGPSAKFRKSNQVTSLGKRTIPRAPFDNVRRRIVRSRLKVILSNPRTNRKCPSFPPCPAGPTQQVWPTRTDLPSPLAGSSSGVGHPYDPRNACAIPTREYSGDDRRYRMVLCAFEPLGPSIRITHSANLICVVVEQLPKKDPLKGTKHHWVGCAVAFRPCPACRRPRISRASSTGENPGYASLRSLAASSRRLRRLHVPIPPLRHP
jgi:hypothetical protein